MEQKSLLQIDNSTAYVNDKAVTLDTPAMIVNDRTMVPAWFVSEAFWRKGVLGRKHINRPNRHPGL